MIGKGKSISHGTAALEYDLAKEIDGQTAAMEIARHELYGCTGAEMVQEMKPYHADFPNVKNNCLRFDEISHCYCSRVAQTATDFADASHAKSTKSVTTTVSYGIFSSENAYPCTVTPTFIYEK